MSYPSALGSLLADTAAPLTRLAERLRLLARPRKGEGAAQPKTMPAQAAPEDRRAGEGGRAYFAVVEFDRFMAIRNTVGFEIANLVLSVAAERVRAIMAGVRVGRTGPTGLEFTFSAASDAAARHHLEQCIAALEQKIEASGIEFRLHGTIAFAPSELAGGSVSDSLFDSVITALGRAESERVRLVSALARPNATIDDLEILRGLPSALRSGELALHYQPKLDCRKSTVRSAEALLRWHSPILGPVPTDRIIELAERTGAIRDITGWTLKQAAQDQAALLQAGHDLTIFVNISGMLIADRQFVNEMLAQVDGARIGIEITETAVIKDPDAAIENIAALSAAGVPVAIDDFGSGLSSLTYLKQLPVDELKIDRLFVSGLTQSHRDPLIVRSAIELAHALEMKVTAEGVDDPMSLSLLKVMGCDMLQGFFISRPVPLPQLVQFLEDEKPHLEGTGGQSWARPAKTARVA